MFNLKEFDSIKIFQDSSLFLIFTILNSIENKDKDKYLKLCQKNLDIETEQFDRQYNQRHSSKKDIEEEIKNITEMLANTHEIIHFLQFLNKSIILNGCTRENYHKFENIRDKFLELI